jgi:hypothetical protein
MAFWPFSKVFGAGLVAGDVPRHSDLNKLDEQQAQAADGSIWSDVAAAANMAYPADSGIAQGIVNAAWCELTGTWFVVGLAVSSINPLVFKASPPFIWGESFSPVAPAVPNGNGFVGDILIVCNPAGTLLIGGTPASGTTAKLRRSTGGGVTSWTTQDTPTALGIKALGWFPAAGQFLVGYASGTALDTSPDGVTWTTRTSPNSHERGAMAASPTRLVWAPSPAVARSTLLTTDDAITFVERNIGVSDSWAGVTYSTALQKWFLISSAGNVRSSTDGITWTSVTTLLGLQTVISVCSYGRTIYAIGLGYDSNSQEVWCSTDGSATWRKLAQWSWPSGMSAAAVGPGGQLFVASRNNGKARFGWRLGG